MKKLLVLCVFALLTIGGVYAQSVVINNKWLEHNVTEDGVKGMKIHVDFNIKGMKGKKGKVLVYFEYPKGTGIKDLNGRYCTTGGKVCTSSTFTPGYDNSHYRDFEVFIPIDEIHMKKGKFTYYCDIRIQDLTSRKFLNGKTYLSFTGTSQGDNGGNHYANNSNRNNNSSEQTWREELGYGMFAINHGDPNGVRQRTIYRACSACGGTTQCGNCYGLKMCPICGGQGGIITAGYGNFIPCLACDRGRCGVCHGTGKCACANYDYPGYMPGSTLVIGPNGEVIYNSYDDGSSSVSSSRSSSSSSSRGSCSKCGGRRYESTSHQYAAASSSGWMPPYHNSGGDSCPYCNSRTDHYHYPCTECRGYGHK